MSFNSRGAAGWHGFLLDNGKLTRFDVPGQFISGTLGIAINDYGQITGTFQEVINSEAYVAPRRGFLLSNGLVTKVPLDFSHAMGINNRCEIVGWLFQDQPGIEYGFRFGQGQIYWANPQGTTPLASSEALAIDDRSRIVAVFSGKYYIFDGSSATPIDVPVPAQSHFPMGINNRGQIVGSYSDPLTGVAHGFLLDNGSFRVLNVPGSLGTRATGINDRGQIVGYYIDAGGIDHGFLATF
jgi:uncharacterized membrane protein